MSIPLFSQQWMSRIVVFLAVILELWLGFFSESIVSPELGKAAGLALITISLFATAIVPEYLGALIFFLLGMVFTVAPAAVVFSGFNSTAVWLIFGGLVLGVAINATGLGQRIAKTLAAHLAGSYPRLIAGMVFVGLLIAFLMPSSMGRVVLLIPISLALADHFGFSADSNGRTGLIFAGALGTFIPAFAILPANVPNMVLAGLAESQLHTQLFYGQYFILHFPILGLIKALLLVALICRLFPDTPRILEHDDSPHTPVSSKEKQLTWVLVALLFFWSTDFWHHISPAWVAMAGSIVLMLPRVNIVTAEHFNSKINFSSVFFVAAFIGMGAVINDSGLGSLVGQKMLSVVNLNQDTPFINYLSVAAISMFSGLATTLPGIPAVMTPLAEEISVSTGFSLNAVLMLQVLGFSTVLMPYQAPPLMIALSLSTQPLRRMMKMLGALVLVTGLILWPLNYLWWQLLGWL